MKTTINKKWGVIIVELLLTGFAPSAMLAQDKVEASVGADLVSGYIWRGQDLGGVKMCIRDSYYRFVPYLWNYRITDSELKGNSCGTKR